VSIDGDQDLLEWRQLSHQVIVGSPGLRPSLAPISWARFFFDA
jgi:hypothetical protein